MHVSHGLERYTIPHITSVLGVTRVIRSRIVTYRYPSLNRDYRFKIYYFATVDYVGLVHWEFGKILVLQLSRNDDRRLIRLLPRDRRYAQSAVHQYVLPSHCNFFLTLAFYRFLFENLVT